MCLPLLSNTAKGTQRPVRKVRDEEVEEDDTEQSDAEDDPLSEDTWRVVPRRPCETARGADTRAALTDAAMQGGALTVRFNALTPQRQARAAGAGVGVPAAAGAGRGLREPDAEHQPLEGIASLLRRSDGGSNALRRGGDAAGRVP